MELIGQPIRRLRSPAFLVNLSKARKNCVRMREKCEKLSIRLRPHVKTHKTIEGALLQTDGKKEGIVVSTIAEAEYFAQNGFNDILISRPVTEYFLLQCSNLLRKVLIHFLANSNEGVSAVVAAANVERPISVFLKISVGYERAGIPWEKQEEIVNLAQILASTSGVNFQGIYAHCGDSYSKIPDVVQSTRDLSIARILKVRDRLVTSGVDCPNYGIGSTPSCSILETEEMSKITEIHPGNYIFYDTQQESYGSCSRDHIACRVMTRVISHQPQRNQLIVDLGFTGLTKQGFNEAVPGFGAIEGHSNLKLVAMTQECGKVESVDGSPLPFDEYPVDCILFVFPYHACASAGMYREFYVHDDEDIVREIWRPTSGW